MWRAGEEVMHGGSGRGRIGTGCLRPAMNGGSGDRGRRLPSGAGGGEYLEARAEAAGEAEGGHWRGK